MRSKARKNGLTKPPLVSSTKIVNVQTLLGHQEPKPVTLPKVRFLVEKDVVTDR